MKSSKKILFPAIAAVSMVASGSASFLTVLSPYGIVPLIDSAVTAGQCIQLPVGSTLYERADGTAVDTISINVISSPNWSQGICAFYLSSAFGASATAPAPAATVTAIGDCSRVSLYFSQEASATSENCSIIRIKGCFKNVFFYTTINPTIKLKFCCDSAGFDTFTPITAPLKIIETCF
ncbi:MAG: hypothetical protein CNLJKLNK_01069 [Holosporales bacterium]